MSLQRQRNGSLAGSSNNLLILSGIVVRLFVSTLLVRAVSRVVLLPVEASPWLPPGSSRYSYHSTSASSLSKIKSNNGIIRRSRNRRRSVYDSVFSETLLCTTTLLLRRKQQRPSRSNDDNNNNNNKSLDDNFPTHSSKNIISSMALMPFSLSASSWFQQKFGRPIPMRNLSPPARFLLAAGGAVGGLGMIILWNIKNQEKDTQFHLSNNSERIRRSLYFWYHAGPLIAHYKFTQWWLTVSGAPLEKRDVVYNTLHDKYCQPCMELVLHLKGLYVKIGQVVSSRPDFIPWQYIELFSTLHDSIPQWPMEEVHAILERTYQSELGLDYRDVFETIDPVALGSASIAQVHRAVLKSLPSPRSSSSLVSPQRGVDKQKQKREPTTTTAPVRREPRITDTDDSDSTSSSSLSKPYYQHQPYTGNNEVAIKVMHPDAKERFTHDLQVFRWVARIALPGWHNILTEFSRQILTEFDFIQEATNLELVRGNLVAMDHSKKKKNHHSSSSSSSSSFRNRVVVPQPHRDISTRTILVMELLHGKPLAVAIQDRLASVLDGNVKLAKTIIERKRRGTCGVMLRIVFS
jgi:hypothetical protein